MSDESGKRCDRIPATPLGNDVPLMATNLEAMLSSPSYILADDDHELLEREEMRGVRTLNGGFRMRNVPSLPSRAIRRLPARWPAASSWLV
jgi:hypothetical protein